MQGDARAKALGVHGLTELRVGHRDRGFIVPCGKELELRPLSLARSSLRVSASPRSAHARDALAALPPGAPPALWATRRWEIQLDGLQPEQQPPRPPARQTPAKEIAVGAASPARTNARGAGPMDKPTALRRVGAWGHRGLPGAGGDAGPSPFPAQGLAWPGLRPQGTHPAA